MLTGNKLFDFIDIRAILYSRIANKEWLNEHRFIDAVSGHMSVDDIGQARVSMILETIKDIAKIQ